MPLTSAEKCRNLMTVSLTPGVNTGFDLITEGRTAFKSSIHGERVFSSSRGGYIYGVYFKDDSLLFFHQNGEKGEAFIDTFTLEPDDREDLTNYAMMHGFLDKVFSQKTSDDKAPKA